MPDIPQKQSHIDYQRQFFDSHCEYFRQPIPAEIEERTRLIVKAAGLSPASTVVDVGTGTGVLIKHFLESGVRPGNITGCDLSTNMLNEAGERYPEVNFRQGDFVEFDGASDSVDAIFFNACFSNIFDQDRALQTATRIAKQDGVIVLSQPLGNNFIESLRVQYPQLVLTLMPSQEKLLDWAQRQQLTLDLLRDEPDFYLAMFRKSRCQ
ncbi:MAG TPA: class I SAM-dependent methyltransferase [Candidatus Obscuribacterales bacterium]